MNKVGIFVADGFEEIEGLTVVDLLRRAKISVDMISITNRLDVQGARQITVQADKMLEEVTLSDYNMLVLPGGMPGTQHLSENKAVLEALTKFYDEQKKIAAICAAPSILGDLGLLKGKKAVCYPGYEARLTGAEVSYEPVVVDGNIITSRGLGTAISFALTIIKDLLDEQTADQIKTSIIYE